MNSAGKQTAGWSSQFKVQWSFFKKDFKIQRKHKPDCYPFSET